MLNPPGFSKWNNLNLRQEVQQRLPYPVFVEHNSMAITRAENNLEQSKKYQNFAVYFINTGIGLGLVLNHEIYTGIHGMGCEVGHTSVNIDGRPCVCGNRGCLELYASTAAILHDGSRADRTLTTWEKQLVNIGCYHYFRAGNLSW